MALIGEAAGENEARDQLPFRPYAAAGSLLERTIRRLGYTRDQFVISNALACRPLNNLLEGMPWEHQALAHCRSNLISTIAKFKPRVIVALGNTALRATTGMHGERLGISHLRGYALRAMPDLCLAAGNPDLVVVPTYHPAFLRRGKISLSGVLARDIGRAVNIARGRDQSFILDSPESMPDLAEWDEGYEQSQVDSTAHLSTWMKRYSLDYILDPAPTDLDAFCRDVKSRSDAWRLLSPDAQRASDLALSWDIETVESASLDEDATDGFTDTIVEQVQFSIQPSQGISLVWNEDHQLATRWLLRLPLPKIGFNNWLFDEKVMRAVGQRTMQDPTYFKSAGTSYDVLQMFHFWQPEIPAHLQSAASFVQFPFPWKHFSGTNLPFYGVCDTDAPLRIFSVVKKTMMDRGIWDDSNPARANCGYLNMTQRLRPILADMEDRGVPVDDTRRLALDKEFDAAAAEVFLELNAAFPDAARKVEPKKGYAGIPPRVKKLLADEVPPIAVRETIFQSPPKKRKNKGDKPGEYFHFELRHMTTDGTEPPRWCRIFDFSPNSSPQIIRYMKVKKHKVPTKKGGGETSDKKELERLAAKHHDNFYFKVIEYRELTKMRGTYIDGFKPHADGCVHTTFTFDTATSQLSCCASWTKVKTSQGMRFISEIEPGDMVWTHRNRWRSVTAKWIHPPEMMAEVQFSDGNVLTCTTGHRVLAFDHVNVQGMADKGKYRQSSGALSFEGSTDLPDYSQRDGRIDREHSLDGAQSCAQSGVRCSKEAPILSLEDGSQESNAGQERRKAPQLEGRGGRWIRISDLLNQRQENFYSSAHDGTGVGSERTTRDFRRASYQQRHKRQSTGQLCFGDESWTSNYSLIAASGRGVLQVEKIVPVGSFPVHDITVEEDESYESNGVFSHNSRNPNVQNVPKHGKLADTFRAIIRHPEEIIVEWDYKSFHVLTTGLEAKSAGYMRLARLDMHSFIAWHFLKLPGADELYSLPDEELAEKLIWFKSDKKRKYVRDKQSKPAILGIGFGLGDEKFYNMNLEHFSSLAEAKKLRSLVKSIFPEVFRWQDEVRETAHQQTFLKSRYGSMRWFYEVKVPDGRGGWRSGEQSEEAIAFLPATDAFGHIRAGMLELARRGLDRKWKMFSTIHDSLLFRFLPHLMEEHIADIHPILTAPSKVLIDPILAPNGLAVDVEASAGVSWAKSDLRDIPLPRLILA